MTFYLVHARHDPDTQRAYVEMRAPDEDGGEVYATAIFSFRTKAALFRQEFERDLVRQARHLFKRASSGPSGHG